MEDIMITIETESLYAFGMVLTFKNGNYTLKELKCHFAELTDDTQFTF